MNAKADYRAFYSLVYQTINGYTPLEYDCGSLCGKACCQGEGRGMYLFPNEENALDLSKYETEYTESGILVKCDGHCDRENRPLACRIFPFIPSLGNDGIMTVKPDAGAFKICPCLQNIDLVRFDKGFLRAVRRAGRLLTADSDCREFLRTMSSENDPLLHLLLPKKPRSLVRK